jgi:formylglycine-generating enzyme required for sulfatase activity
MILALAAIAFALGAAGCRGQGQDQLAFKLVWPFDATEARRRQKKAAEALGVPVEKAVDLGGGIKLELVLVPDGQFTMGGRSDDRDSRFLPPHPVRIPKPFWIGKYEVTQEVWQKVMGENPSKFKNARNPVEMVSWDDCQKFLKKLNDLLPAEKGAKGGGKFRLPSEAEWEWACRAGSAAAYCFGDDEELLKDHAWFYGNSETSSHPVGQKKPNAWGLFDMHGNVWEWCEDDWHDSYRGAPAEGIAWVDKPRGAGRVVRDGSWYCSARECRSAYRNVNGPLGGSDRDGFRLVLSSPRAP